MKTLSVSALLTASLVACDGSGDGLSAATAGTAGSDMGGDPAGDGTTVIQEPAPNAPPNLLACACDVTNLCDEGCTCDIACQQTVGPAPAGADVTPLDRAEVAIYFPTGGNGAIHRVTLRDDGFTGNGGVGSGQSSAGAPERAAVASGGRAQGPRLPTVPLHRTQRFRCGRAADPRARCNGLERSRLHRRLRSAERRRLLASPFLRVARRIDGRRHPHGHGRARLGSRRHPRGLRDGHLGVDPGHGRRLWRRGDPRGGILRREARRGAGYGAPTASLAQFRQRYGSLADTLVPPGLLHHTAGDPTTYFAPGDCNAATLASFVPASKGSDGKAVTTISNVHATSGRATGEGGSTVNSDSVAMSTQTGSGAAVNLAVEMSVGAGVAGFTVETSAGIGTGWTHETTIGKDVTYVGGAGDFISGYSPETRYAWGLCVFHYTNPRYGSYPVINYAVRRF